MERELEEHRGPCRSTLELVPGKLIPGTRWAFLRAAAPGTRRGKSRARALVRCSCGLEQVAWVEDIRSDRSHGCRSKACQARWNAVQELRPRIEALLEGFLRTT